ncbi:glycosyltransferase [Martelella sp. FLE1502]
MKTALITTVFNEGDNIEAFLTSIRDQSELPNEVVVVDGGSRDETIEKARAFETAFRQAGVTFRLIESNCNIAEGRNIAVSVTDADIIFSTDAGCKVDHNWFREMKRPFQGDTNVDVVGGNFKIGGPGYFQRAFAVVGHKNKARNNPSSRSFAFRRKAWEAYPYPESLVVHEDTKLCNEWRALGFQFAYAPNALVTWFAEPTMGRLFRKFARYAEWGARARDPIDPLRGLQILTYVLAITALFVSVWLAGFIVGASIIARLSRQYLRVRRQDRAIAPLALIPGAVAVQATLDAAVIAGTLRGFVRRNGSDSAR